MTPKTRLSASVDVDLVAAAHRAVAAGRAPSLSAWVSDALQLKLDHDRRMTALDEFLDRYESEHGEITEQEMDEAARRMRSQAVVVRGKPARKGRGVA